MLTGRDGQTLLEYVSNHPNLDVDYRNVFAPLRTISRWASAKSSNEVGSIEELQLAINQFSTAWRSNNLACTNKLHLFERHLIHFIQLHNGWGEFGEQGLFGLRRC
jgi:hypothetical protein